MMVRSLLLVSRIALGLLFAFSGFVKGIDPLGTTYKFNDYFVAFGLEALAPMALPLAFVFCASELLIGLLLLFNVLPRLGAWGVMLFMALFFPLTLYIAIFNPIAHCGCFGDAIVLSNWATFYKNIPVTAAALFLFYHRHSLRASLPPLPSYAVGAILLLLAFAPSVHGYRHLPLFDFRPYSVGSNIPRNMEIPPDAPVDVYRTILYYEKDGVVQEFTEENIPWQDPAWAFVDSRSVLVSRGYTPPIPSFALWSTDGHEVTHDVLGYPGYYLLAIAYRLDRTDLEAFDRLNEIYFQAREQGIGFACVTASGLDHIEQVVGQTGAAFPFLQADEVTLKTMIRANPGLMLLREGTVIGLWHHNDFPEASFFQGNLLATQLEAQRQRHNRIWMASLALGLALLLIVRGQMGRALRKPQPSA